MSSGGEFDDRRNGGDDGAGGPGVPRAGSRLLAWRGTDPARIDAAVVTLDGDRLTASGTSTGAEQVLRYRLTTDTSWVTTRLEVALSLAANGARRELDLRRDPDGSWSARRTVYDPGDWWFEDLELDELRGAEDVDLALCPLTNTMPVLRGGFVEASRRGERLERTHTVAWVDLPHLTVEASQQTYRSLQATDDGAARVRYRSEGFAADLVLDGDGLVLDYPGVAVRIDG